MNMKVRLKQIDQFYASVMALARVSPAVISQIAGHEIFFRRKPEVLRKVLRPFFY